MAVPVRWHRWLALVLTAMMTVGVASICGAGSAQMGIENLPVRGEEFEQWLRDTIADMTVAEKVGQMFVPYVYGDSVRDDAPAHVSGNRSYAGVDNFVEMIEKYHIGGIILAGWAGNFVSPRQTAALTNDIQEAALSQRVPIPLLLGADAEAAAPIGNLATAFPGNMALGAARDPDLAYNAARAIGLQLKAVGINQNYAPVADVNVNPANPVIAMRSFGSDPELVAGLTVAQMRGYQDVDVVATAKHFPGHGDTDVDSHVGLPVINHTIDELWAIDLPPFQAAIDAGVDAIMSGHIVVPAVDPRGRPATISRPILTGLLREQMGFEGVIVTDALNMQGVRQMFGDDRVAVEAILAGVDMLLYPVDMALQYDAVMDALSHGEISEERLDASVDRILRLKVKRGLFTNAFVDEAAAARLVGSANRLDAVAAAQSSITLVKNDNHVLPLGDVAGTRLIVAGATAGSVDLLATALTDAGAVTHQLQTGTRPDREAINEAVAAAYANDVLIVLTTNATAAQRNLVYALRDTGTPVVTVAVDRPYDINVYPDAETHLATYGARGPSMEALAKVLIGELNPSGRLPVMIPAAGVPTTTLFPLGHGLRYRR